MPGLTVFPLALCFTTIAVPDIRHYQEVIQQAPLNLEITPRLFQLPLAVVSWMMEEILRGLNVVGVSYEYYHYRTGGGAEVDLILDGDFGLLPIEIKYGQKVVGRELRGIRDFIKENNCPYGIVINNDECVRLYDENLLGIPFACCLDGKTGGDNSVDCINQET